MLHSHHKAPHEHDGGLQNEEEGLESRALHLLDVVGGASDEGVYGILVGFLFAKSLYGIKEVPPCQKTDAGA